MQLTKSLLKKLIREAIEDEMSKGGEEEEYYDPPAKTYIQPTGKLSKQAIKHLEHNNFAIEYDHYNDTLPGHVYDDYKEQNVPETFIATEKSPEEYEDDDAAYRHGELGNNELWVGTYAGDEKVFRKTGENLDGYYVCEEHGMGTRYIDGPFESMEEAKQKGVELAKKHGMVTYDELKKDSAEDEEDEGLSLNESMKKRFRTLANLRKRR